MKVHRRDDRIRLSPAGCAPGIAMTVVASLVSILADHFPEVHIGVFLVLFLLVGGLVGAILAQFTNER